MSTTGNLRLEVIEAKLTRDTEFFSKMDPYVTIETRQQKFTTKTIKNGGKTPVWNAIFDIDVKYVGDEMSLTVYDKDLTKSDMVGTTSVKLSSLCVNGGLDDWFTIQFKGKSAGQVRLKGTWKPTENQQPQANMGQNAAMGMFGAQPMGMGVAQPMGMGMQQPMMQ